jgi:hypothetical protein
MRKQVTSSTELFEREPKKKKKKNYVPFFLKDRLRHGLWKRSGKLHGPFLILMKDSTIETLC